MTTIPDRTRLTEDFSRAQILQQQGQLQAARQLYQRILDAEPDNLDALNAMGVLAGQSKDMQQAIQYFERAIAVQPGNSGAHCNRGLALAQLNQPDAAIASFDQAIALDPHSVIAHYSRAETCKGLGHVEEALFGYDRAVTINPGFALAFYKRGVMLQEAARLQDAIDSYDQVIRLIPGHFDAHANRALSLFNLGRNEEACAGWDQAIAMRPNQAALYVLRGHVLRSLDRLDDALISYERAISINPDDAEAHFNRGLVLLMLNKVEAVVSFDRAIAIKPDYAEAYYNRGYSRHKLRQFDLATADYRIVASLAPDTELLPGTRLETSLQICDWSDFDSLAGQVAAGIERDTRVAHPFICQALTDSAPLQYRAARLWVRTACPANDSLGPIAPRARARKLKIGYFSCDFREHPVGHLLAGLIESHDRSRFETIAFSFGGTSDDVLQQRFARAFDRFIDVRHKSSLEIAALARSLEVDIAIDLVGHTLDNRTNIFALRAAPIQVNYLGYPGTMGADYMDYLIGDRTVVPVDHRGCYAEKIIYMPDSYLPFDSKYAIADAIFAREELNLPPESFVFCCFNNPFKITPNIFDSWIRILRQTEGTVLWLSHVNPSAVGNLQKEASQRGVDPQRLIFAERWASLPEHVARFRAADLFLDTLPYNAHATALDALWAGLPVLTREGRGFAGRVAASLLSTLGVPELITSTQQEYERLAIELAANPQRLGAIRTKIQNSRLTSPLFDTSRFTRNLEAAYAAIYDRYMAGLLPDHIEL